MDRGEAKLSHTKPPDEKHLVLNNFYDETNGNIFRKKPVHWLKNPSRVENPGLILTTVRW